MYRSLFLALLIAGVSLGQVNFDLQGPTCTYSPPSPCGTAGDAEGISWNGNASTNGLLHPAVDTVSGVGMPVSGAQFLRVPGARTGTPPAGMTSVPAGGPIQNGYSSSDVYIPMPAGTIAVSFSWDFYEAEVAGDATYNDAGAIEIVGACGGLPLATLAYADTFSSLATITPTGCPMIAFVNGPISQVLPAGPQTVTNAPVPAGGTMLRIRSANSGDNAYPSHVVIDNVTFSIGTPNCATVFSSPAGPGSVLVQNTTCPATANQSYFWAFTFAAGSFPNGNWHGLDTGLAQLVSWYVAGYPFIGPLDGSGASSFFTTGLPSGLAVWEVTTVWTPGFAGYVTSYAPTSYVIP